MCNRRARFKKIIAAVLSLAMVVGSSTVTFAEVTADLSPETDGAKAVGGVEAWVEKDVFRVELPTVSDDNFKMILDPQGLIAGTSQAAYTGKTFESNQNVFFARTSGNEAGVTDNYTHKSDVISVNNTGSVSINVAVQVSVNKADGIKFVDTNSFTDDKDKMAKMYLAVIPTNDAGTAGTAAVISNNKAATVSEDVGFDAANFTVSYDAVEKKYFLSENATPTWKNMTFQLEAGINKYGDFADLNAPEIDVIWTVKDASGPKIRLSKGGLIKLTNLTADRNLDYDRDFTPDTGGSVLGGVEIYNVDTGDHYYLTAGETWYGVEGSDPNPTFYWATGGNCSVQLGDGWLNTWKGSEVYAKLYLTDGTTIDSTHVMW